MTFKDLKSAVAATADLNRTQAGDAITALIEHIRITLEQGGKIVLPGLGRFEVSERLAWQARNPQTGEPVLIPASRTLRFKASKTIKDAIIGQDW